MPSKKEEQDMEQEGADDEIDEGAEEDEEVYEDEGEDQQEEGEEEDEFDGGNHGNTGTQDQRTSGEEIDIANFAELLLDETTIQAVNESWRFFITACESREAAGEVIYAALFESVPSLQSAFVTPRAVQAMRFLYAFSSFLIALDDPPRLKVLIETLGFGHLSIDVTPPRVAIFRDAILDIFAVELGDRLTSHARDGWFKLLNYIGGAIIFVKTNYAERVNILLESWRLVNIGKQQDTMGISDSGTQAMLITENEDEQKQGKKEQAAGAQEGKKKIGLGNKDDTTNEAAGKTQNSGMLDANQVPTTYIEMFRFNSAVMGFGASMWMGEILDSFDNIVSNCANSARFQEECEILVLRLSKVTKGTINFGQYKSCMLASLRSLLPKDWSTQHEVAWSWLWENVERTVSQNLGNPPRWEKALTKVLQNMDETTKFDLRKDIYARFFVVAPAGQNYFKQSNTYLHFIMDRILDMTLELFHNPVKLVDDVSALGLRHVGYAIPTDFFGPFVSCAVEQFQAVSEAKDSVEAFRWSVGLISKMLVRTIQEGSTIVMKAINTNSSKQLNKAIALAPRGERAMWLLKIQVGTQSISPLTWSISSGALDALDAILQDLLTIRADRDRYYYGMDKLFDRHPDIVQRLTSEAPSSLPTLLNGLIWRSRTTESGMRRINYYVKHLLVDTEGSFSKTLAWVAKANDPVIVCHPILAFLSDTVWTRVAQQTFLYRKMWFLVTMLVFMISQAILKHIDGGSNSEVKRIAIFSLRAFIYMFSMTQLLWTHLSKTAKAISQKQTIKLLNIVPIPAYLRSWQDSAGFLLMLMLLTMLIFEPIIWCVANDGWDANDGSLFSERCPSGLDVAWTYSVFSALAMFLYHILLIDLAVLSTKVSAYVLVCFRMLSEFFLFLLALVGSLLTFATALSVIKHKQKDFEGIHYGLLHLLEMALGEYNGEKYKKFESDPLVLIVVFAFLFVVFAFLFNMLVAQLTCAYEVIYLDMMGYARLERIEIIVATIPLVSKKRWSAFVQSLKLDQKCEFGAGDIGVNGGVQIMEAANLNPTTEDSIKRHGGSTAVENQWPTEEIVGHGDEEERFERLETLINKTVKRMTKGSKGNTSGGSLGHSSSQSSGKSGDDANGDSGSKGSSQGD